MWLAGGGVKGGYIHGATDEFGFHAIEDNHQRIGAAFGCDNVVEIGILLCRGDCNHSSHKP